MGANTSTASGSESDAPLDVSQVVGVLRSSVLDMRDMTLLSWETFLSTISDLNQQCKDVVDKNGKFLLFAIKKGSTDTMLWKATVRICCLQMNSATGKVESRRVFSLPQFMRAARALSHTLEQHKALCNNAGTASTSHTTVKIAEKMLLPNSLTTSILMDQCAPFGVASSSGAIGTDLNGECVVCLERRPDVILPCAHCYCRPCIEQWKETDFGDACPVCRAHNADHDDWVVITNDDCVEPADLTTYLVGMAREA